MIRRIERDGGTRHQVYAQRGGRKVYVGTYDSRRAALDAEEDFKVTQRKIDRGELPPEIDDRRTLDAAVKQWLEGLKQRKVRAHRAYSDFMKSNILPDLGGVAIARLTKPMIMRWRDDRSTKHAPGTVNSALTALSAACSEFVDRGWIAVNPCHGVARLEVPPRAYNWIRTRPELERLLRASNPELREMVAIAVGTGIRLDEMLHVQWDDVDLDGRLLCIQRGRNGPPKAGRIRFVPLVDSALAVLRARALRRAGAVLVFPNPDGKVRAKQTVGAMFKAALVRSGLDKSLRWHDLRHTMASWWMASGGCVFRLSRLLGHSDVKITATVYGHLAPTAWREDYHRIAFDMPAEAAVIELERDGAGRITGHRLAAV